MTRTNLFKVIDLAVPGQPEKVIAGGRDKFHLLPQAFEGVQQICVLGWSSQAPAQAQNLRDSLAAAGSDIKVVVGLRKGSASFAKAAEYGFTEEDGTAGEMLAMVNRSHLVLALISDAGMVQEYKAIQGAMKSGATLGLSHGFLLGHMQSVGDKWRSDINVVMSAPKGMGPSLRKLYLQGAEVNGAGINASYAVEQDYTGTARNIALGWAVGIGSPYVFQTTLTHEYRSDIFGERGVLLGAVWGIAEALHSHFTGQQNMGQVEAYVQSAMSIVGPISKTISKGGLKAVYEKVLSEKGRADADTFMKYLQASYEASKPLLEEIYNEVKSGREIASVVDQSAAVQKTGWLNVAGGAMWQHAQTARDGNYEANVEPVASGVYLGTMLAQCDVLRENGHGWSEIANESIIEATDSLNPYIAARDIAYMVDNCSTTARLGARKWGPRFQTVVQSQVLGAAAEVEDVSQFEEFFLAHDIHQALAVCMEYRPPVDIAVQ